MPDNLRYLLIVALVSVFIMAGCLDEVFSLDSDCTLTVEKEGEGEVTPTVGNHRYGRDTVVVLNALPANDWRFVRWEGEVADPSSSQTTVVMEGDRLVRAVFANGPLEDPDDDPPTYPPPPPPPPPPPNDEPDDDDKPGDDLPPTPHPPPEGTGARVKYRNLMFLPDGELDIRIEAWNCSALEGLWYFRHTENWSGIFSGSLIGEATFTMPPRHDNGPWESSPFSYEVSGTTLIGGGPIYNIIEFYYEDVVITFKEVGNFIVIAKLRYTLQHLHIATCKPEGCITAPPHPSYPVSHDFELGLVILESHPECGADFFEEPPDDDLPLAPIPPPEDLPLTPLVPQEDLPLAPLVPQED